MTRNCYIPLQRNIILKEVIYMLQYRKKAFAKLTAIFVAVVVVFGLSFVAPPRVYADSTPTLEEIKAELLELERRVMSFTRWNPQYTYDQDAKVRGMVANYSGAHPGDMLAYKAYLDEYAKCLSSAKDTLASDERILASMETETGKAAYIRYIATNKKVIANIVTMQEAAQNAVFTQFATVTYNLSQGKASASMKGSGQSVPVTVTGQIKANYYFKLTASIVVENLGTVPYTLNHEGWSKQSSDTWRYYQNGYYLYNGYNEYNYGFSYANRSWEKINNKWYDFDSNGVMKTGWFKDPNNGNKWFYLGSDGAMKTGWQKVSGTWYHLSTTDSLPNAKPYAGKMQTGWQKLSGSWYYLGGAGSGVMRSGWQQLSGKWYYFGGPGDGKMKTGWYKVGGKWYYSNSSGAMQTGKVKIGGKTYRFAASGALVG
jgi:hypothetical protein